MTTLFISDLHLDPERGEVTRQFLGFLEGEARDAETLYILGDLFEAWVGDDDPDPEKRAVVEALSRIPANGVSCYIMHGNRDFLIGERFCEETGFRLLEDGTVVDIHGTKVLLMHGDTLCTDDLEYQKLRHMVRNPQWQAGFLSMPVEQRLAMAQKVREQSRAATMLKAAEIMDVNQDAVQETVRSSDVRTLVHGHTHRPAIHSLEIDGAKATRVVLGDWHEQGSVLRWDGEGYELVALPRGK